MQDNPNLHGGFQLAEEVRQAYKHGQIDYSMEALVRLGIDGIPIGVIKDGDAVIFCCRRGEREVELTEIFTDPDFGHFHRQPLDLIDFTILTLYHEKFKDLSVAFAPTRGSGTLGEMASKAGLKQFRCSESEKFSHVTYFLNGGTNEPYPNEIQKRVPSLKGIPFEQIPELSLLEVTDEIINALQSDLDLVITNFANGDVIGHTSNKEAKVLCAEAIDHNLERVVIEARRRDYITLITADHGNLEVLYTVEGKPHVAHTSNLVPLIIIDPLQQESMKPEPGKLADLAPTILAMLNVPVSKEMNGNNLLPDITWHQGRKVLLIILDGWGEGPQDETNPIFLGQTPFWDEISSRYPHTSLAASGEAVGLQTGKPGNSEAGHMNIGAGHVVLQDDARLDMAMKDGSFYTNTVLLETIEKVRAHNSKLHLIGLLTEKSSHGSIDYPLAILRMAKERNLENVYLHLIFDGRSTEPGSAPLLLEKLERQMQDIGLGQIATGVGRGIALDRGGNYGKVKIAYDAMVNGIGKLYS